MFYGYICRLAVFFSPDNLFSIYGFSVLSNSVSLFSPYMYSSLYLRFSMFSSSFSSTSRFSKVLYCSAGPFFYFLSLHSVLKFCVLKFSVLHFSVVKFFVLKFAFLKFSILQFSVLQFSVLQFSVLQFQVLPPASYFYLPKALCSQVLCFPVPCSSSCSYVSLCSLNWSRLGGCGVSGAFLSWYLVTLIK